MSTPFADIYKKLEIIKDDIRIKNKPTNLQYELYYDYLSFAIGIFQRKCYKDLTHHTPFQQIEYWFISDGSDTSFVLDNPSLPLDNGQIYIGYSKDLNTIPTEITTANYTYDENTHTMVISGINIPSGNIIYASSYIVGEFLDTLDYDEKLIIENAMLIPYQQEQQNRNNLLNQKVYGASQSMYSQAQHISAVSSVVDNQRKVVDDLIYEYTYLANPRKSKGLGGGLI